MSKEGENTVALFQNARRRCVDHLRALIAIRAAHESISALLALWESADVSVSAALHSASVIAYSRPFVPAFTKEGKIQYPVAGLKDAPGFDRQLHRHLINLRDRLIAHADYDVFPSTMYLQTIGDEALPLTLGVNVKAMAGIRDRALAERYESHFRACSSAIESMLNDELKALAVEAQKHPAEFAATNSVPVNVSEYGASTEFADLPGPTGPASDVADPTFPSGLDGYRYATFRHQIALVESGTYRIHEKGVAIPLVLDVSGSRVVGAQSDGGGES